MVGGAVLLAHAIVVLLMMLARPGHPDDDAKPLFVTMMIDLSRQQPMGDVPIEPKTPALQLQKFAPQIQDIPVEHLEIEPEIEPVESPLLANTSPPASAPATGSANAGFSGEDAVSSGRSGRGDGLVLLQRVLPAYPKSSARAGEQGVTTVIIHVTESGRVDDVRVERSSGSRTLDKAAVEAFYRWKFQGMPSGTAPEGRWMRTVQRFILYRFMYSRLLPGEAETVYEEHLKPKPGVADEPTSGGQEALARFIAQVRDQTLIVPDSGSRAGLPELRSALEKWGAVKSVWFTGIAGSSRWVRHRVRPGTASASQSVEVSWNMFEVRHENNTSVWLIALGRDGEVWAARASQAPWM
jgi:periplasmic protein TonB